MDTPHTPVTWQYFFTTIEEVIEYLKLDDRKESRALAEKIDSAYSGLPMVPSKKPRKNKFRD